MIRSHTITLWLDGQMWEKGFLRDPPGTIGLYSSRRYPIGTEFTAATLPPGVKVCPCLTLGHDFAPKKSRDETKAVALRYGYEIFEIDIVPW